MRVNHFAFLGVALLLHAVGFAQESTGYGSQRDDRVASRSQIEDLSQALGAAPSGGARPMIYVAIEMLKSFEGWDARAYDDPAGYCTIGYGHLIALKRCREVNLGRFALPLSDPPDGTELLEGDTRTARLAVQRLVKVDLTDEQFGALSSFVFNVGKKSFAGSTLLILINAGQYKLASREFGRWVKANGRVLQGLVERRACEASLFLGQIKLKKDEKFQRSSCQSLGAAPTAGELIDIEQGEQPRSPR